MKNYINLLVNKHGGELMNDVCGIILLAGNSLRYGKNTNKNLELLNNQYVFFYSLKVFLQNDNIEEIILVVRDIDYNFVKKVISELDLNKSVKLVIGGNSRQESVYHALLVTNKKYVVIHDAARPMIKSEYINKCLNAIKDYDGVVIGQKVKDTIKIANDKGEIISSTKRINTWAAATPQVFRRDLLIFLHEKYLSDESITDDSMLLEKDNYKVKIIEGDYSNIKITMSEDLEYLKTLIKKREDV